ncbi:hypothetical protein D3C86_1791360 [compost metagenome]
MMLPTSVSQILRELRWVRLLTRLWLTPGRLSTAWVTRSRVARLALLNRSPSSNSTPITSTLAPPKVSLMLLCSWI